VPQKRAAARIPIIDLFAGPGGLGEGFSAYAEKSGAKRFHVALSVEKDALAHQTLELRAFFRATKTSAARKAYYKVVRGELNRESLFTAFPNEAATARSEAWHKELAEGTHKQVADRVKTAVGGADISILIGGPPCQAYSLVGRARNAGNPHYRPQDDDRHTLYQEYLRVLSKQWPAVFVMENVKGLLSARYRDEGMFQRIINDLQDPLKALSSIPRTASSQRYRLVPVSQSLAAQYESFSDHIDVSQFVVRCERHGIPQKRHRLILVGVREDLFSRKPLALSEKPERTTHEALSDLPRLRSGLSSPGDSSKLWIQTLQEGLKEDWFTELALKDPRVTCSMAAAVSKACEEKNDRGSEFISGTPTPEIAADWFLDAKLAGFANHSARAHIADDLKRYLFAAAHAHVHGRAPTLRDFPDTLLPEHQNARRSIKAGVFVDRFRVQLANEPSTTVTSHISKDGHYYIHYDPSQCRSMTVREAARLQTFPDNYLFCGPRTAQYHQVGNAVPPLLAGQLAEAISRYLG
jgi:DNA (cytosine-5)-methyltransferase 1